MKNLTKKHKLIIIISFIVTFIVTAAILSLILFRSTEPDANHEINMEIIQQFDMGYGIIGRLQSEVIDLDAPIRHGIDYDTLDYYIGHFPDTSLLSGNIALAAHNRGYPENWFERLHELEMGDRITYITRFDAMHFEVTEIKYVHERDVHILYNTPDTRLTLVTCVENNRRQRLIVIATLITEEISEVVYE